MFRKISFQNFKSWKDTGEIELAPITGFFGANSSGKSSILQFLLMLKQTMESTDRQRVLHTGDDRSYVNLGTLHDIAHQHILPTTISFSLEWLSTKRAIEIQVNNPPAPSSSFDRMRFSSEIWIDENDIFIDNFYYRFFSGSHPYNNTDMELRKKSHTREIEYELKSDRWSGATRAKPREAYWKTLPSPIRNYGFPEEANNHYTFLSDFALAYEKAWQSTYYLGPLREYPKRTYYWSGENPQDVGRRGEFAIPALLSSRKLPQIKHGEQTITIEERIAIWLKDLGLIDSFCVQPIAEGRQEYEVKVRRFPRASDVLITDVGFGVSQVLPVLVLCYYVPEGSTIIFEQPEIHLHPSVQSGLADVLIDVMKTRNVQIILESHSEHLLHRLQRRIAEEKDGLTNQDVKLYFCNSAQDGSSNLTALQIDSFGNIANWPENFFGDEMGDLFAMTEAAMKRQLVND